MVTLNFQYKTNIYNSKFALVAILCVFALIFTLISIPNHQLFRTHALDLGMMNKTLYDLSHFHKSYFTLSADGSIVNYFGDHFSPIMYLYVPFYYLFGSYTLLIIQLISILLGGLGIYKIALLILKNEAYSLLILIHFFCIWGICSA